MAKGIHASYTKIGAAVIMGVAALVLVLIWLGGVGLGQEALVIETYSVLPVSGLSVGSSVNFRGVKIGEVRRIGFIGAEYEEAAEDDWQTVYIEMHLDRRLMQLDADESGEELIARLLKRNLHATISPSGITGMSRIELNYPKVDIEVEPISWEPHHPCVPPAPSIMESFSATVQRALKQLDSANIPQVISNVASVADSSAKLMANANELLEAERARIDRSLANLEDATEQFDEIMREIKANPSLLIRTREYSEIPETAR